MGIKDWFNKDKEPRLDPLADLTLDRLKQGYLVEYDLKTWEVAAAHRYDWGGGDLSWEWQLKSGDEVVFLSLERDDQDDWSLYRRLAFSALGPEVRQAILDNGDPPSTVTYEGVAYHLSETAGGHFFKNGAGPGQPLLSWFYEDEEGELYLSLEQWGEEEFEASTGIPVEEYQFTNILPGRPGEGP